jgi:hypothetical protein
MLLLLLLADEEQRVELLRAAAARMGGNAKLGRALGYQDGAFVGQMLRRECPISEKTLRKLSELPQLKGLADQLADSATPKHLPAALAHGLSYTPDTVPTLTREELMQAQDLPPEFWVQMHDDAMSPRAPRGKGLRFRRSTSRDFDKDGQFGEVVLLLAPDGTPHVRLLGQELTHGFQLRPTNPNYASFVGSMDGLQLLGVMTAIKDSGSLFA